MAKGAPVPIGKRLGMSYMRRRHATIVRLTGVIDESLELGTRAAAISGIVVFDLDGVTRITSSGVRQWMNLLNQPGLLYYCFIRCRPAIVAQFNMVANFGRRGQLISFYAPYVCQRCGTDVQQLVDLRKQHGEISSLKPPAARCPACGEPAEFDDVPESYFLYAAGAGAPNPPPHLRSVLDDSPSDAFRVDKEIAPEVTALWMSGSLDDRASLKRLADGLEGTVLAILADVNAVTQEGLQRFGQFIDALESPLNMARLPPVMIHALHGRVHPKMRIVSVHLPFDCLKCDHTAEVELTAQGLADLGDRTPTMGCELCLGPATADPVLVRAARGLPMVPPPADVAGYLGSRPLGHPATIPPPRSSSDISGVDSVMMGKYKLLRRIGTGGMAEIFLARQQGPEGFQKTIALKRILPHLCQDDSFIQMFLQEARVAARVSHPNVVQILDLGQIDGRYFIAMEYVKGSDLRTILRVCRALGTRIPIEIVCRIGSDVCAGLSAAHGHRDDSNTPAPIVHRDISPHNVLVAESGVCKITDFGIAKAADSISETVSGVLKGKLTYLAPERLLNVCDPLDVRPDLFSIGVVLYECVTGVHPFRRENEGATVHAILNEEPEPLASYVADVPEGLERIIRKALSKIPDERYFEAQLFRRELEELLVRMENPATSFHVSTWLAQVMKDAAASAVLEATHTSIVVDPAEFTPSSSRSGKD